MYSALNTTSTDFKETKNKYPFVFVHGFNGWGNGEGINKIIPYWGATCGDLISYLIKERYESYSASVGPFSSAWDRACELYAQLVGGTVDYGAAHSAKFNHNRYGRTYEKPLFKGWGQKDDNGDILKIHLIGHSFGGTTIRMLAHMMTYGIQEEIDASPNDVSPLFTGGKEDWIYSIICISTPHNSASTYYFTQEFHIYNLLQSLTALYAGIVSRTPLNGTLVDFHLEQFGLTSVPGDKNKIGLLTSLMHFLENSDDSCQHDLCPQSMKEINERLEISPNIHYYSFAFSTTKKNELTGLTMPRITTDPLIAPLALWIGHHKEFIDSYTNQVYDESWKSSDSLCNTISETYPFDEPHKDYDNDDETTGIWNVMPVSKGDHGQAIGLLANKTEHRVFYDTLAIMLVEIEK